jgi:hypothetical protein
MKRGASRTLIFLSVVGVLQTAIPPAAVAAPTACSLRCNTPPPVRTVSNGYTYSYDAASRTFVGVEKFGVAGKPGASYDVVDVIDCGIVTPPNGGANARPLDCQRAQCRAGARIGRWIIAWYRETAPVPAPAWTNGGRHCAVATDPIPLPAVEAAAAEHLRKTVAPALPIVQPGAVTLVNFPTIVSTRDPGPLNFAIALPLPGVVDVTPAFTWSFTDPTGPVSAASGAGTAFDGTPPATPGHYLTHEFVGPGTATVAVTETWTGTVTVPGVDPVALDPLPLTNTVALAVHENRPVLVGQ